LSIEPGGMITCSGFRQPAFSGMSSSTSVRNTYSTAAMQTAVGALKLLVCWALVPVKSMVALRAGGIDADRHLDLRAVVQRQREGAVLQARDDAAHRLLGVVLHMAHVGLHHVQAELVHHLAQLLHALSRWRRSAPQVGHVLLRVARRVGAACSSARISASRSTPRSPA
jgi:hypothetical protein